MTSAVMQTAYYALGIVIMKGISFLMMPVTAHFLSPAEYGQLDVLINFLNVSGIVLGLGLAEAMYRMTANARCSEEKERVVMTAYLCSLAAAGAAAVVLFALLQPLARLLPGNVQDMDLAIAIFTLVLSGGVTIPLAWMRMRNHASQFFWVSVIKAATQAGLTWTALHLGYGVRGVLIAGAIAQTGMTAFLAFAQLRGRPWQIDFARVKPLLIYGVPLVLAGLCSFGVSGFERWMIADSIGVAELAHYAMAMQFAMIVGTLVEPFSLWFFPRRFALLRESDGLRANADLAMAGAMLSFASMLVVVAVTPLIFRWWMPASYRPALEWLPWLALAAAFRQASFYMNLGCYVKNTTWLPLSLNGVLTLAALVAYSVGLHFYGLQGVVAAALALACLRFVLFLVVSQRVVRLDYAYLVGAGVLMASLGCLWTGPGMPDGVVSVGQLVTALLIFVGSLWFIRGDLFWANGPARGHGVAR